MLNQPVNHLQRGGFTRAGRANQHGKTALLNLQRQVANRLFTGERFAHLMKFNHVLSPAAPTAITQRIEYHRQRHHRNHAQQHQIQRAAKQSLKHNGAEAAGPNQCGDHRQPTVCTTTTRSPEPHRQRQRAARRARTAASYSCPCARFTHLLRHLLQPRNHAAHQRQQCIQHQRNQRWRDANPADTEARQLRKMRRHPPASGAISRPNNATDGTVWIRFSTLKATCCHARWRVPTDQSVRWAACRQQQQMLAERGVKDSGAIAVLFQQRQRIQLTTQQQYQRRQPLAG